MLKQVDARDLEQFYADHQVFGDEEGDEEEEGEFEQNSDFVEEEEEEEDTNDSQIFDYLRKLTRGHLQKILSSLY